MDTYEVYLKLDKQISFENKIFPYTSYQRE